MKSQYRKIVAGPGLDLAPNFLLPGNGKEKVGKKTTPDSFILDNLETSLTNTVDKSWENSGGAIVEMFVKPRE